MKTIEDLINELEEKCREEGKEYLVVTRKGKYCELRGNRSPQNLLNLCNIVIYTIMEELEDRAENNEDN